MRGKVPACICAASFCMSSGADGLTDATSNAGFPAAVCPKLKPAAKNKTPTMR